MCFDELPGSRGIFLSCGHFGCLTLKLRIPRKAKLHLWSNVRSRLPTADGKHSHIRGAGKIVEKSEQNGLLRAVPRTTKQEC